MGLLKQAWLESGCVYGYRKLHDDLRSLGESCSLNKIARLTNLAGIKAQIGYKRKAGFYGGKPAVVAPNHLDRVFNVAAPDQGSQFTSYEWQRFLKDNNLKTSMSRRGNCYDNAVAESFFQLLKRERIRRKTYATRKEARQDIFDYIEFFYNPKRKHGNNVMLSPVGFKQQQKWKLAGV